MPKVSQNRLKDYLAYGWTVFPALWQTRKSIILPQYVNAEKIAKSAVAYSNLEKRIFDIYTV